MKTIASWGLSKEALCTLEAQGLYYGKKWVYSVAGGAPDGNLYVVRRPRFYWKHGQRFEYDESTARELYGKVRLWIL